MIQLISLPQALVKLVIPHLLCFSVYNEGNTVKQLEDWTEEIHRLYHVQELTKTAEPVSILQTQINHVTESNYKVEEDNEHLQKQLDEAIANNQELEKRILELKNDIIRLNSEFKQEVIEVLKKLALETAEPIAQVVTLHVDYKNCQSAVKVGSKDVDELIKRANKLKELVEKIRRKEDDLRERLKIKNKELEKAEKEIEYLKNQLDPNEELLKLKPEERDQLLLNATAEGNVTVVKKLLELGANISVKDELGSSPLILAAYKGNIEIVKVFIDSGADLEEKDGFGNTPLFWATLENHYNITKILLDKGANINVRSDTGGTVLHLAAFYGYLELAKLLVERGADVNVVDENGRTPREDAIANNKLEVADFLSKHAT